MPKVYVLELIGDIVHTPACVTLEVGGVSMDRSVLERLMVEKEEELNKYFSEDEDEEEATDDDVTYMNYDLCERPSWIITEHDLL